MIAKLARMSRSRDGREWEITFTTPADFREEYDRLDGKMINVEIKEHRNRRSLDANAMAWVLINQIAEKTGFSKVDVYRQAIRDIGGVSDIICVQDKAVERLVSGWEKNGLGWMAETFPSRLDGCTNVILYYGSSTYDSKQMSQLIDDLIRTAEEQGIPTAVDRDDLIQKWGRKEKNENVPKAEDT